MAYAQASAPPFPDHDDDDEEASDLVIALELQRFFEAQAEDEALDETIAYSLTMDQAWGLHDASDRQAEHTQDGKPPVLPHCVCCREPMPDEAQRRAMPCAHVYCVACVRTRCQMGVRDRSLAPAHCCKKEFPTDYVRHVLSREEFAAYDRFVDERVARDDATDVLVSDAEYAAVVARHGWKQCPRCGVGVEKTAGCNAIRCLRGHLFCWSCVCAPCVCGGVNQANYLQHAGR